MTTTDTRGDRLPVYAAPPLADCNVERVMPPGIDPEYDLRGLSGTRSGHAAIVAAARLEALRHRQAAAESLWRAAGPSKATADAFPTLPHVYCPACGRLLPAIVRLEGGESRGYRVDLPTHGTRPGAREGCPSAGGWQPDREQARLVTPWERTPALWDADREAGSLLREFGCTLAKELALEIARSPSLPNYHPDPGAAAPPDMAHYVIADTVAMPSVSVWRIDHELVWGVLHRTTRTLWAQRPAVAYPWWAYVTHRGSIIRAGYKYLDRLKLAPQPVETFYHPDALVLLRLAVSLYGRLALPAYGVQEFRDAQWRMYLTAAGREMFRAILGGLLRAVHTDTAEGTAARLDTLRGALALAGWRDDPAHPAATAGELDAVRPIVEAWSAEGGGDPLRL